MRDVPYTIRPIDSWPGEQTRNRRVSQFAATRLTTLDQLDRELRYLGAKNVSLLMAVTHDDIRLDGHLRANARPSHPGVVVAFDSKHGPLKYAVDTFTDAWDNLRAIALGLEALRKVDRYGVTKRGEQYSGWKQIGSGGTPMPAASMSLEDAARMLAVHGLEDAHESTTAQMMVDPAMQRDAYKRAAKRLHPDKGGDPAEFQRLQAARELLEAHRVG